jgi:hypothetical protein
MIHTQSCFSFHLPQQVTSDWIINYRYCLWILGNATTLSNSGSIWADLVRNAKDRRCFFNASSDKAISHVIAKQKSDLRRVEAKKSTPRASSRNYRVWVLSCRTFSTAASDLSKLAVYIDIPMLFLFTFLVWCIVLCLPNILVEKIHVVFALEIC